MLIDWFTVGAQVLNFVILVWLLKRFLYMPILDAIDAREKHIAAELADADAKKAEAKKERDEFQGKNDEFDREQATRLRHATDEAKAEGRRLLDGARQAADVMRAKRHEALKSEQQSLNDEIRRRTREEVFAIARKTLTDLAGTTLEERMGEVFTRRLRDLDGETKEGLAEVLRSSSDPVLVRSAFELPSQQQNAIQHALNETFAAEIQVRFETAPDVISGIALSANGWKVAWNISDYLASLENSIGDLLQEEFEPQAKPETQGEIKPKSTAQPAAPEEAK
jgi:F-type H+-transporting ATPase subunit b